MSDYSLFATTPKAMETLLSDEIRALGGSDIKPTMAGAAFRGSLETAYKICLWSRTANRVLLQLADFEVESQDALYRGVQKINWFEHLKPDGSFAVSFNARHTNVITNTHFGALKVKDAIVDQMRNKFQKRPNIDTRLPDIRINVYLNGKTALLSLDLSGESLHKRGYRESTVEAPIKENLAAAILIRSGWPQIARQKGSLIDPMCGSGTLPVEAALIAADIAPGLLRQYFGFLGWKKHQPELWQTLRADATARKQQGLRDMPVIVGFDQNRHSIAKAIEHAKNAGLEDFIHFEKRELDRAESAESWPEGLIVCNPPYGERLGTEEETAALYRRLGNILKQRFSGWKAGLIISNPELGFRLGIRSQKPITFYNGALECKLLRLNIEEKAFFIPKAKTDQDRVSQALQTDETVQAEMFANRLKKNLKKISKWARQNNIHCYRLYDADLPEYAVAVDIYQGNQTWVHVQEYEPPKTVSEHKANSRLAGIMAEIPRILDIDKNQVFLKIRRRQKSNWQYQKHNNLKNFHVVEEHGCQFLVNFEDYLDTGLFLDHRPMRLKIQQQAPGKRFLNLFAYTATATVHAAKGGATKSVSVDMSNTYLDWARQNFDLNHLDKKHSLVRANCLEWLEQQASRKDKPVFDLIFLDPPTFSNSKRMDEAFDIQQDHVRLIQQATHLLDKHGILYFSTNYRKFKMDSQALNHLYMEDITSQTIPADFARNPKIHFCWKIQHKA